MAGDDVDDLFDVVDTVASLLGGPVTRMVTTAGDKSAHEESEP